MGENKIGLRAQQVHHGGAAGGLALSVLAVMHKDSKESKESKDSGAEKVLLSGKTSSSFCINSSVQFRIAGYGLGTLINTLSKRSVPQIYGAT